MTFSRFATNPSAWGMSVDDLGRSLEFGHATALESSPQKLSLCILDPHDTRATKIICEDYIGNQVDSR